MKSFDFEKLESTEHMLQWLHPEPIDAIKNEVTRILTSQVPGSVLLGFQVRSKPDWLTGARPSPEDANQVIVVRAGLAFEFALEVQAPEGNTFNLQGVYSWVGVNLDDPEAMQQRIWFDIDGDLATFGSDAELKARIYFD